MSKKEDKLIEAITNIVDAELGERSQKARAIFHGISSACRELGYKQMGEIMETVGDHYTYE